MGDTIDVVVIDDHALFARGLELLLNVAGQGRVRVVAATDVPHRAVDLVTRYAPDVALVDLAMPPPGGLEVVRVLRRRFPQLRLLVLSGMEGVEAPLAALGAGADGFLPKASDPETLVAPLLSLLDGWQVVTPDVLQYLLDRSRRPGSAVLGELDAQECSLWRRVANGASTDDLARDLHLSERSVKRLVAALLRKLGVGTRIEAAALAGRCGLLDGNDDGHSPRPREATPWPQRTLASA